MSNNQTCILVLGMHRSGTSALAGALSILDVYLGRELMEANFANEKGYFENSSLYEENEKLLAQINSSWDDMFYGETKLEQVKDYADLKQSIKKEFEYSNVFAIKDPRLVYLFPVYEKVLKELDINIKIIIPFRNPLEVANSLNRRDGMSLEKAMLLWGYNVLLAEKFSRNHDRVFMEFDDLMANTYEVVESVSSKLNIDLLSKYEKNKKNIDQFLEPSLKHHNIEIDNLSLNTPKIVKDVLSLKDRFNDDKTQKDFDAIRDEFFSYQKIFYNQDIIESISSGEVAKVNLPKVESDLNTLQEEFSKNEIALNKLKEDYIQKDELLHKRQLELVDVNEELSKTESDLLEAKEFIKQKKVELLHSENLLLDRESVILNNNEEIMTMIDEGAGLKKLRNKGSGGYSSMKSSAFPNCSMKSISLLKTQGAGSS